ncbi:MAG: hypothetical protein WBA10_20450 [Elainellaceae cyanobacterium]
MSNSSDDSPSEQLQATIREILSTSSAHPYSFISMVKRFILQYDLDRFTHPHEIINIAYERAIAAEKKQVTIVNYKAWLRSTCLNIVRETSRQHRKELSMNPQSHAFDSLISAENTAETEEDVAQLTREQRIHLLLKALEQLIEMRPDIGQLMRLRLLNEYDWADIQQILAEDGETCKTATLRKRASRGKRLLRRIYHQLEDELLETQGARKT